MGCTGESTLSELPQEDEADEDEQQQGSGFHVDDEHNAPGDGEELPEEPYEEKADKYNRLAQGALAKEVLAEIPNQIRDYMLSKGIKPENIPKKGAKKPDGDKEGKGDGAKPAEEAPAK